MLASETILVTGASGFIGTWVTALALKTGAKVRATVRDPQSTLKTAHLTSLPGAAERLELVALDLTSPSAEPFERAVRGCTMVLHTASPFPGVDPADENVLIKPAVEGTLSVLRAVVAVGGVTRVVITSSVAAVGSATPKDSHTRGEKDWTDVSAVGAYAKSKTLAEKAAWDFHGQLAGDSKFVLCTINPSLVTGPCLGKDFGTSVDVIKRIFGLPMQPRLSMGIVDVRDVALAHIAALTSPAEAVNGRRFLLIAKSDMWFADIANSLMATFGPMGYRISAREAPDFAIWLLGFVDAQAKRIYKVLGAVTLYDTSPSVEILKVNYVPAERSVVDTVHSLIELGQIPKKSNYAAGGWSAQGCLQETKLL